MTLSFWWRLVLCIGVGQGLFWWLTRSPDDRRLRHVVFTAFWLRIGLVSALYALSYYHWPILRSLHGREGFWTFALDARLYHTWAVSIAEAWKHGIELPDPGMSYDYLAFLAGVYRLFGTHPLYGMLLHAWCGTLTGWLAYRIGQRLFDRRTALRAACFVSFWPSAVLWSTQILRDVLSWCLILTILWLVILIVGPDAKPVRTRWRRVGLQTAALLGATILLTRLRVYLGSILVLTALLTLFPVACGYLMNQRVRRVVWRHAALLQRRVGQLLWRCFSLIRQPLGWAVGLSGITALMIAAVMTARGLNIKLLLSPAHPEKGHVRLGIQHQQRHDVTQAEAEFRRAIDVRPNYQQAYLLWADMLATVNRPGEAFQVCASWPGPDSDGMIFRCAYQIEARLAEKGFTEEWDSTTVPQQEVLASVPGESAKPDVLRADPAVAPVPEAENAPLVEVGPARTVCCNPQSVILQGELLGEGWPPRVRCQWTQQLGPPARIVTPNALKTEVNLTSYGVHQFVLTVSSGQLTVSDGVAVTLARNQPPDVEAGPAQIVGKPQTIHLHGTVQDDGWPANSVLTYQWSQFLGPPARIVNPTALDTDVEFTELGVYQFGLIVSDGELSGHDETAVTVEQNKPPKVEAGPPEVSVYKQTTSKQQSVRLRGEVQDDGWPANSTLTYQWVQLLGPPARIMNPAALDTQVHLPDEFAKYRFRLTASDGELSGADEIAVSVSTELAPPIEPVASGSKPPAAVKKKPLTPAAKLVDQWLAFLHEMSPQSLGILRSSVIVGGGNALVDANTNISRPLALITYLPRALLIGFLAPFPWQWFDTSGSTGGMRLFAGAEAVLIYVLLIGLALRAWGAIRLFGLIGCVRRASRRTPLGGWFLLVYGLSTAVSASLVMANLGTLFRLRLLFWLPLLILVAAGDPLGAYPWYRWLVGKVTGRRSSPRLASGCSQQGEGTVDPASLVDAAEGSRN